MATGIPLPGDFGESFGRGVERGGSLFSRIMQPMLEREKMKQAEQHFQEQLKLRKAAAGRAGANSDLQRQLLMQKLDPMHDIKQLQLLTNYLNQGKGANGQESAQQSYLPAIANLVGGQNNNANNLGENESFMPPIDESMGNQGHPMGALQKMIMQGQSANLDNIPELNEKAVSPMEAKQSKPQGGLDMDAIKNSPILRGWFKKHYGVDPGASEKGNAFTGSAREGLDMARLKKQFGENSEEYRNAQHIQQSKEDQRKDLSAKRQRELHGLRPGDLPITDPKTGEEIGFSSKLTKEQQMQEENRVKFDMLYPYIVEGASVFSGPGATKKLEQAARTYKTNPQSKKLIDDFMIAEKALTNATVTEAARFGSGKQNQVFNRYRESLQAADINEKLKKWIKEFEIPAEANRDAGRRWQKILGQVDDQSKKMVPARRNYYNDPRKQFQHDEEMHRNQQEKAESADSYHEHEMVRVQGPNGIEVMTYAEAKRKGAI